MGISDILELESANTGNIYLLQEGIFYRAYNRSAMRLCLHFQSYKVNVKYIKKVKQEIYYCGFPVQSFEKVKQWASEKGYAVNEEEKQVTISGLADENDYEKWMEPYKRQQGSMHPCETHKNAITVHEPVATYNTTAEMLIQKIREYPLENSTPMQAMLFVQELKKEIQNGSCI